jgi:hypothetical protein
MRNIIYKLTCHVFSPFNRQSIAMLFRRNAVTRSPAEGEGDNKILENNDRLCIRIAGGSVKIAGCMFNFIRFDIEQHYKK